MLLTLPAIRVQYSPKLSFVRFQWNPGHADLEGLREGLTAVVQLIEYGTVASVLLDMNELPSLGLEDQFWLATHWIPRVSVPTLERAALVLPISNVYNQMAAESLLRVGRPFIHYDVQFFTDASSALGWLLSPEPIALAALEAEWESTTALRKRQQVSQA